MTSDSFAPLLHAPAVRVMGLLALAMLLVYGLSVLARRRGGETGWAPFVLRVLAVLALVLPGWGIIGWYRQLSRARELTEAIPVEKGAIAERFVVNSVALLSLGFLLLVAGIYLAKHAARARGPG